VTLDLSKKIRGFFSSAEEETPEYKIFSCVMQALNYISYEDFIKLIIQNIIKSFPSISKEHSVAIKHIPACFENNGSPSNVNNLLCFVLFGKWQDVGLDEIVENPLEDYQRAGIIQIVFLTAASIVQQETLRLVDKITWEYKDPNFKYGYGYGYFGESEYGYGIDFEGDFFQIFN
jgi:hypothetical protein